MNGRLFRSTRNQRGVQDVVLSSIGPAEFNAGPIPHRIFHDDYENIFGMVGGDVNYQPEFGDWAYIQHQPVLKRAYGTASRAGIPTIDDTAYVPAFSVGS